MGYSTKCKLTLGSLLLFMSAPSEASRIVLNNGKEDHSKDLAMPLDLKTHELKCEKPGDAVANAYESLWPSGSPCNQGLFADTKDGSIRSYNLVLTESDLAKLNSDPTAEKYVPCDIEINYGTDYAAKVSGAKCRYKGSVGSFGGCFDNTTKAKLPSKGNKLCRHLSWKINLKKGTNKEAALGTTTIQLLGMQHDDSLLKNRLSYAILNDAGFVAPCAAPANLYVNGIYSGLMDMIENVDSAFTKKRSILASDENNGGGTLYKETWPSSSNLSYYKELKPIKGLSNPGITEKGDGKDHSSVFANLRKEAEDCLKSTEEVPCTKEKAEHILDTYVDAQSFIDGLVGMTMVANWDQIIHLIHNFYIYIRNDKLFYIAWDFNEVLVSVHAAPFSGVDNPTGIPLPFPWYHELTAEERKVACPWGGKGALAHFTCDPVAQLMAKAYKEQFFDTFKRVSEGAVPKAQAHIDRWKAQTASAIACEAENGNWPPVETQKKAAAPLIPTFRKILDLWAGLSNGTAEWPVVCSLAGCHERSGATAAMMSGA